MKLIWKLVEWSVKLAVLAAGFVIAFEVTDRVRDREKARYLVDEDFTD